RTSRARPLPVRLDQPGVREGGKRARAIAGRRGILHALDRSAGRSGTGAPGVEHGGGAGARAAVAGGGTRRVRWAALGALDPDLAPRRERPPPRWRDVHLDLIASRRESREIDGERPRGHRGVLRHVLPLEPDVVAPPRESEHATQERRALARRRQRKRGGGGCRRDAVTLPVHGGIPIGRRGSGYVCGAW